MRRNAVTRVVTASTVLAALALPVTAAADPVASIAGDTILIVDSEGEDDDVTISAGGSDANGRVWEISGADAGAGCTAAGGGAQCDDGRFRDGGDGPTRSFDIRLAEGDDELDLDVSDSSASEAPGATVDLGPGDDELDSSAANAHTVLGGEGADLLVLSGFFPRAPGSPPVAGPVPLAATLDGGPGNDVLDAAGRTSGDVLIGGTDEDLVSYLQRGSFAPVTVTLDGVANDGRQSTSEGDDVRDDVEAVIGTPGGDTITGDGAAQTIDGAGAADTLDGAGGTDTLSFESRTTAVTANLTSRTTTDGDTLAGFENVRGGAGNDVLTGDGSANRLEGRGGADMLRGAENSDFLAGEAGNDVLDGGPGTAPDTLVGDDAGSDTAIYGARTEAVNVTLGEGNAIVTTLDGDTLQFIRNVTGGSGDDRLIGNSRANTLNGGAGRDRIDGLTGNDTMRGHDGDDVIGPLRATPQAFCTTTVPGGRTCTVNFFRNNPPPDGLDSVSGGNGRDVLSSVDGAADERVLCGAGTDNAEIDLVDPAASTTCEHIRRGAFDQHPITRISGGRHRVQPRRRVTVKVACPEPRGRVCAGRLALRRGGKRISAIKRYRVRAGEAESVTLRLSKKRLGRSRRVTVRAVARERDRSGRPLISSSRLRLRRR